MGSFLGGAPKVRLAETLLKHNQNIMGKVIEIAKIL
jgi:hypothetical protein